jgi:hypothetical protein
MCAIKWLRNVGIGALTLCCAMTASPTNATAQGPVVVPAVIRTTDVQVAPTVQTVAWRGGWGPRVGVYGGAWGPRVYVGPRYYGGYRGYYGRPYYGGYGGYGGYYGGYGGYYGPYGAYPAYGYYGYPAYGVGFY